MAAGRKTGGRKPGSTNKMTRALKDMILQALDDASPDGSVAYLTSQAKDNPTAFLTLVGKVLPLQVAGDINHAVKVSGALQWKQPQ